VDGCEWSALRPGRFIPGKRDPLYRGPGGSQSPGCGGEKNIPNPCWELKSGRPSHSLVAILTELPFFFFFLEKLLKIF